MLLVRVSALAEGCPDGRSDAIPECVWEGVCGGDQHLTQETVKKVARTRAGGITP